MKSLKAVIEQHIAAGGLVTAPEILQAKIVESAVPLIHSLVWANIEAMKKDFNKTTTAKVDAAEKRLAKWLGVPHDQCPGHE